MLMRYGVLLLLVDAAVVVAAIATVVVGIKNELQIRSDADIVRDREAIEQLHIGLSGITHLVLNERLSKRDRSHRTFLK